jgi:hypothetical protein
MRNLGGLVAGRIAPDKLLKSPVHQQRLALGSLNDYNCTLGHGEMIGLFLTVGSALWADGLALLRPRDWAALKREVPGLE